MGISFLYQGDAFGFVQAPRKASGLSEQLACGHAPLCLSCSKDTGDQLSHSNRAETYVIIAMRDTHIGEACPSRGWDRTPSGMAMACQLFVQHRSHSLPSLLQTRDPNLNHGTQTPYLLQQHARITRNISGICLKSKKAFPYSYGQIKNELNIRSLNINLNK